MNIITPITITTAMVGAGTTVTEDATPAWVTGTTYTVGTEVHVPATHRVYRDGVGGASSVSPELASTRWVDVRPTNRFAPFDIYTSTAAAATTSMTYVLSTGYCNAVALYGVVGDAYTLTVKASPGGATIDTRTGYFVEPPAGWYEYLFGGVKVLTKTVFRNLALSPTAEITLTITAATGNPVRLGMFVVGDFKPLLGDAEWGGAQHGSSAEPITYSYISTAEDGTVSIKRRHSATNLRVQLVMPLQVADYALAAMQSVLDVPVAWITSSSDGLSGLNAFGLGSGSVSYGGATATASLTIKGMI